MTADHLELAEMRARLDRLVTAQAELFGRPGAPELAQLLAVVERYLAPPHGMVTPQALERAYEATIDALLPAPTVIEGATPC